LYTFYIVFVYFFKKIKSIIYNKKNIIMSYSLCGDCRLIQLNIVKCSHCKSTNVKTYVNSFLQEKKPEVKNNDIDLFCDEYLPHYLFENDNIG